MHLTAVRLLAPHLCDEDHLALLAGTIHKSTREVVALLARWFPSADVPSSVRKLPIAAATATANTRAMTAPGAEAAGASVMGVSGAGTLAPTAGAKQPTTGSLPAPRPEPAAHRPIVAPLAAERYRLQVTIDGDAHDDLRRLQDMMRREIPDGDAAAIVARALKLLRHAVEKNAFSATDLPRRARVATRGTRHIPAHVERAVWKRDDGQCAFEGHGRRCAERSFLEFHHVKPWAVGGPTTAENIALRCRTHNAYDAAVYFRPIRVAMADRDEGSFRNESAFPSESAFRSATAGSGRGLSAPDP